MWLTFKYTEARWNFVDKHMGHIYTRHGIDYVLVCAIANDKMISLRIKEHAKFCSCDDVSSGDLKWVIYKLRRNICETSIQTPLSNWEGRSS
jgi:hypothetical protein